LGFKKEKGGHSHIPGYESVQAEVNLVLKQGSLGGGISLKLQFHGYLGQIIFSVEQ
jgi:hypothetical protein